MSDSIHRCDKSHGCDTDDVERRMRDKCEVLRNSLNRAQREFSRACEELQVYRLEKRAGKTRNI
jgi:hypothetical protein